MKYFLLISTLLISLSSLAKGKDLPEAFYNCWSASYEEDSETSKVKTFRLCDYKFPPKMFRPTIKINKGGTCQVLHVGPTDQHFYVDCTWTYDKKKKRVTIVDKDKKVEMKFIVRSVDKDLMKIVQETP